MPAAFAAEPAGTTKQGVVYRYLDSAGLVHYTNKKPPSSTEQAKLLFDYVESVGGQAWLEVASGENFRVLVHPRSIKLKGRLANGWVMTDYEKPEATS